VTLNLRAARERISQTLSVFLLTVLAVAAAAAGPWLVSAAGSAAASADIAEAPPAQRVLTVREAAPRGADLRAELSRFRERINTSLPLSGVSPLLGATQTAVVSLGPDAQPVDACTDRGSVPGSSG
jgi:hypothetical protein